MEKVPVVPGLSRKNIQDRVVKLIGEADPDALSGKQPINIESIFEFYVPDQFGIDTGYTDLSRLGPGVIGYTNAAKKISYVDSSLSDSDHKPVIRRCRATIGHEIGHCTYHVPILRAFKSSSLLNAEAPLYRRSRTNIKPYCDPEWQAWEFAMACLMPNHLIFGCLKRGYNIREMAECFDVNPAFLEVRLKTLKIKPF